MPEIAVYICSFLSGMIVGLTLVVLFLLAELARNACGPPKYDGDKT
jgi:hypothetical protein